MYCKLKYVVIYLKLLTNFVILRSFGNLKYESHNDHFLWVLKLFSIVLRLQTSTMNLDSGISAFQVTKKPPKTSAITALTNVCSNPLEHNTQASEKKPTQKRIGESIL